MREDLEKSLKDKYPLLYADMHNTTPQRSCMCWGVEAGDGWYELLDTLGSKLEPLIKKYVEEHGEEEAHPRAAQVKEKFGGLRFYMTAQTDEMTAAIVEAEDASETICERCGAPGVIRDGGWMTVKCDKCHGEK
jgi:ribosomal protein L40E